MPLQSKQRQGRWKRTERERFFKGLEKYGKNWNLIQMVVKTRSVAQIRSHAQKVFSSMSKSQKKSLESSIKKRFHDFCEMNGNGKILMGLDEQNQPDNLPKETELEISEPDILLPEVEELKNSDKLQPVVEMGDQEEQSSHMPEVVDKSLSTTTRSKKMSSVCTVSPDSQMYIGNLIQCIRASNNMLIQQLFQLNNQLMGQLLK